MNQDPLSALPPAPSWSLLLGQIGKGAILAGLAFFVIALIGWVLAGKKPILSKIATGGFVLGALSLFTAFGILTTLFVKNQFQFEYIFARGDIHTALQYKVAGVWSGQQGSFLLWACASAIFGLLALKGTGHYLRGFGATYAAFLGTLCGILAYETPFNVMKEIVKDGVTKLPPTGNGMVPSLQNYWVVIHPPTIFLGFGALTILFAYAIAAIVHGDVKDWVSRARPWALASIGILGLGICMGGFWAYETLGWGGFWMWDPVENASFVPWLFLVAFAHGILVQVAKKRWHGTNLILAALPFIAFAYGTFLTRSGFLEKVSVHSFASMDKSALKILQWFLGVVFFGFVGLYLFRGRKIAKSEDAPVDAAASALRRDAMYGYGMLLLSLLGVVIAVGMSWPLLVALAGKEAAVIEEPLYHKVVVWFFVPVMILMAIAPFVSWRGMEPKALFMRLVNLFSITAGIVGFTLIGLRFPQWGIASLGKETISMPFGFRMGTVWWIALLSMICVFVAVTNLWRMIEVGRKTRDGLGGFVSHIGMAVLMAGLVISRGFEHKEKVFLRPGQPTTALGYTLEYSSMEGKSPYDRDGKVLVKVTSPEGKTFEARPGLFYTRRNDGSDEPFVWPHIQRYAAHDVYLTLHPPMIFFWEEPGIWFKPGEKKTQNDVTVEYVESTVIGEPGTPTAKFGAKLKITLEGHTHEVEPTFSVGEGPDMPRVNDDFRITMMRMDVAEKAVLLQMLLDPPVYGVELFTKPFTGMVWGGTGIMTVGGLMSAWSRRRRRKVGTPAAEEPGSSAPNPRTDDAPLPVA